MRRRIHVLVKRCIQLMQLEERGDLWWQRLGSPAVLGPVGLALDQLEPHLRAALGARLQEEVVEQVGPRLGSLSATQQTR